MHTGVLALTDICNACLVCVALNELRTLREWYIGRDGQVYTSKYCITTTTYIHRNSR